MLAIITKKSRIDWENNTVILNFPQPRRMEVMHAFCSTEELMNQELSIGFSESEVGVGFD
jgi:hypothetical protein